MPAHDAYTFVHPEYFEPITARPPTADYADVLAGLLPDGWTTHRFDIWLGADPPVPAYPAQGFKLHISARPDAALETLRRVVPVCVEMGTSFKLAGDPGFFRYLSSKGISRGSAGKFMTLYPRDTATFVDLAERLREATRDLAGPYILSDKRLAGSGVVFYRYGGFALVDRLAADGTLQPEIADGHGEMVADDRLPYFHLPAGITDPFPDDPEAEIEALGGRFEVTEAIAFTNAGGVYKAIDREGGAEVVLKEARPHTNVWVDEAGQVWDSVDVLRGEFETMEALAPTGITVRPLALFQEWEHTFLAQELVPGLPLRQFRAHDAIILAAHLRDPARVRLFCAAFRTLARDLVAGLGRIHALGYVLGDLSPNNIMIETPTLSVRIIDLESAHIPGSPTAPRYRAWYTSGFRPMDGLGERDVTPADDLYALGMSLFSMVFPVQPLFELEPAASERVLGRFVQAGLPLEVRAVLDALCAGDALTATAILDAWTSIDGVSLAWSATDWFPDEALFTTLSR